MKRRQFRPAIGRALAALYDRRVIASVVLLAAASEAYAGGGLNAGSQAINNLVMWLYGVCGTAAGGYLLWEGVMCWSKKADWVHDFGGGVVKVAGVGSALVLAGWAFGVFG